MVAEEDQPNKNLQGQYRPQFEERPPMSFRDKVTGNNPHLQFYTFSNPFRNEDGDDYDSDDDPRDPNEVEYPRCPIIRLMKEQKRKFRTPWKQALKIKMLDKGVGFI